jgi:hypothetical protein
MAEDAGIDVNAVIDSLISVMLNASTWSPATCSRRKRDARQMVKELEGPSPTPTQQTLARLAVSINVGQLLLSREIVELDSRVPTRRSNAHVRARKAQRHARRAFRRTVNALKATHRARTNGQP